MGATAWEQLRMIEDGTELVVGVNSHVDEEPPLFEGMVLDSSEEKSKISMLKEMKAKRDKDAVNQALDRIRDSCIEGANLMEPIISAVKVEATVGEVNNVLREEFGTWVSPSGV